VGKRLFNVEGMPVRRWLATTPGRLRLASVVLVAVLVVMLVVTAAAARARQNAAHAVGVESAPELVAAEDLYVALADADATASTTFLKAGLEDPSQRQRYVDDVNRAGQQLATVSKLAGSSEGARAALRTITEQLPVYAGLVEEARANSRQGFPVGAAYLRQASTTMRDQLLPAATTLYEHAGGDLDADYRSGTSTTEIVLVAVGGVVLLGLLIGVQVFVTRRSHRVLNVALAVATVVVAVLLVWVLVRFHSEQDALVRAQRNGSDAVQVLSAARILNLKAQSDDNLALIQRGTGQSYVDDYKVIAEHLGGDDGHGGLLGYAHDIALRTNTQGGVATAQATFAELLGTHKQIRSDDDGGNYEGAVKLAIGTGATTAQRLDAQLESQITRARAHLDQAVTDARRGFAALDVAIVVILVLAGVLVLVGLQARISEYR
jgi:hypothetical protein